MESQENEKLLQKESDKDMMTMFASVWVKVEVETPDSDGETSLDTSHNSPLHEYRDQIMETVKSIANQKKTKRKKTKTKTLFCDLCDYTTSYKNCLALHLLGHKNSKPFSCVLCNYSTKYPNSLQRHVLIKHQDGQGDNNDKPATIFKCDFCQYTTPYKWNLSAHSRKHKPEKQFKCSQCSYETAYRHNYIKHGKIHMEHMVFKCDKCPFQTKFEGHITRHLSKIHNEVMESAHKCDLCDFATLVKWRLNVHKQRSKNKDVIKCIHCAFESYYNCEMKKHKETHFSEIYGGQRSINRLQSKMSDTLPPSTPDNLLQQNVNNMVSNLQDNLEDNFLPTKLPENLIPLKFNKPEQMSGSFMPSNSDTTNPSDGSEISSHGNSYNSSTNIDENYSKDDTEVTKTKTGKYRLDPDCVDWHNIQVLESDDKDRPFLCLMCPYTSRFKASVQRHFQRHHTGNHNRPYKCCNCDFSTKTKDQIALHNKRSKSDIEIFCTECQFRTWHKCELVMHQKSHFAFKCPMCDYTCRHRHELQKHFSTIHLGNGMKCRFCDYKSARKESVLCHETIHTGIKPFKCNHCEYSSVRRSLLDNHLKRYHSNIKSDITIVDESKIESLKTPLTFEQLEERSFIENQLANSEIQRKLESCEHIEESIDKEKLDYCKE